MITQIKLFIIIFCSGELLAFGIFYLIRKYFQPDSSHSIISIMERVPLMLGLINNFSSILAFFGAIKIATRLKETNEDKITNDYFLIGNFPPLY